MKLQQKLESSLDDIIKVSKKEPKVSNKSKGITRTGSDKLKRLKQLNKNKQNKEPTRSDRGGKPNRGSRNPKFNPRSQNSNRGNKSENPQGQKRGGKKWTAPKRASRSHRNFKGRNRN